MRKVMYYPIFENEDLAFRLCIDQAHKIGDAECIEMNELLNLMRLIRASLSIIVITHVLLCLILSHVHVVLMSFPKFLIKLR